MCAITYETVIFKSTKAHVMNLVYRPNSDKIYGKVK